MIKYTLLVKIVIYSEGRSWGVKWKNKQYEYCIGESYWGNGYASKSLKGILKYSFENSNFSKLEAFHRIENHNSGRVLQKVGMKKVLNVKRFEINNELPLGEICYALTKYEYLLK